MDIEDSEGCSNDFLAVKEGQDNSTLFRKCGSIIGENGYRTMGNQCQVIFRSDEDLNTTYSGFQLKLSVTPCSLSNQCGKSEIAPYNLVNETASTLLVSNLIANPQSWPWHVSIFYHSNRICAGSLIGGRFIVTAAHCFRFSSSPSSYLVVFDSSGNFSNIESIKVHPDFGVAKDFDADIAVIKLSPTFTSTVPNVCLGLRQNCELSNCLVIGYNIHFRGQKIDNNNDVLKQFSVPVVSSDICTKQFPNLANHLTNRMVCGGNIDIGPDTCEGDSGGAMLCQCGNQDRWHLKGLVSFGAGCSSTASPGVFTKVDSFTNWIENQLI